MRRVVLDTNCLLQALPSRSPYHKIWTEILAGRISLCVNTDILNEYEEILAEKTSAEIAHNVVEAIARLNTTEFQEVYIHFGLIEADPDDKGGAARLPSVSWRVPVRGLRSCCRRRVHRNQRRALQHSQTDRLA